MQILNDRLRETQDSRKYMVAFQSSEGELLPEYERVWLSEAALRLVAPELLGDYIYIDAVGIDEQDKS